MISKTSIHASLALSLLAGLPPQEYAGAALIAKEIGAPQNYLGKLLKILAENGLLESQKGFNGGFRLAKPASKISLYDIVEPIDRVSRWGNCFLGGSCKDSEPCAVHNQWNDIRSKYLRFLRETTVADLATKKVELKAS